MGQDGGLAVGDQADPAPTEIEETQGGQDSKEELGLHSPKVIRAPRQPTPKEREIHEAIHIPHEDWCEFCARGRARNKPHLHDRGVRARASPLAEEERPGVNSHESEQIAKEEEKVPKVSMDYFFLGDSFKAAVGQPIVD